MRNKIKQLLNKEEGFTLVELLAVLAILALIVGIAIPMVGGVVKKSETKAYNAQIDLVQDAARLYELDNGVTSDPTVKDLITAEFLEEDVLEGKLALDPDVLVSALEKK